MSNATPVQNGFLFQDCSAIVLFFDHIKDVKSFRVEGQKEDIEFELNDGSFIYSQSKYCSKDLQKTKAKSIFQDALRTLSLADSEKCSGLVYTTNIILPFGPKTPSVDFGHHDYCIDYSNLSQDSKNIIDSIIETKQLLLDRSKLSIRIIAFQESDLQHTNSVVYQNINRFLNKLGNRFRFDEEKIMSLFMDIISYNKNNRDLSAQISKHNIIWILIDYLMSTVDPGFDHLDPALRYEVESKYEELISIYVERIQYTTAILYDYKEWCKDRSITAETVQDFVTTNWKHYSSEFDSDTIDFETLKALTILILSKILTLRYIIEDIKGVAGIVD